MYNNSIWVNYGFHHFKIELDTTNCEGGDGLIYQYFYNSGESDPSMNFLGKGKRIQVFGPPPLSGNSIKFVVKVRYSSGTCFTHFNLLNFLLHFNRLI